MASVDKIFDLRYGHSLELNRLTKVSAPAGVNFVGRAATNNGVTARVLAPEGLIPGQRGEITVSLNGQGGALASFVQPTSFITGYHVMILTPKNLEMSTVERLWWARCIWANHYRYGFGRQANRTLMSLQLPDTVPDWVLDLPEPTAAGLNLSALFGDIDLSPPRSEEEVVRVDQLFDLRYGHSLELNRLKQVEVPQGVNFVGRSASNNGVTARVAIPNGAMPGQPGEITVALGGSVLSTFVQPESFLCGRDVMILSPKDLSMSKGERFWWAHCIAANQYRYNYGRQANRTLGAIKLPSAIPEYVSEVYDSVRKAERQTSSD